MKEHRAIITITECILCFTVCSLIGWLYEIGVGFLLWKEYVDRGILWLPLCPIYGFGGLLLIFLFRKRKSVFGVFCMGTAVCTLMELAASYVLEFYLHGQLWSYEEWPFHFQGRISLFSSLVFGIFSVLAVKAVWPALKRGVRGIPALLAVVLDLLLVAVVALDSIMTLRRWIFL